ncbi:T9SS type A sorting domain-containing protein [Psychroserpens ponticola]|uniref:T9SS type A sorting domain-containing protein n=1 Tax=Psychroserpens ponticola TaxID=2932268 RepID=A0ABY7RV05_9FLAO|nr:T9SS type A sorting domain-containing protein [Psychroserpens ponticola]WCO00952.1 T9SS type A sorting domain-containing protein [Psychroserpens ponticola]
MKNYYLLLIFLVSVSTSWSQEYRQMIAKGTYTVQEIQQSAEAYFAEVGTERGKGYKPFKRWEYQALQDMDENGMLPTPEFYYNELINYNSYLNQNFGAARTAVGTWQALGPDYWNQTSGWNPGVGRVTSVAVEPANPNHMIVGANTGGVWRSVDGGANWTVLTDNLSNLNVSALAMDPTNTSTYFWGSTGGTIFRSTDSGTTWNFYSDTGSGTVNKILIDPTNTTKMYASVEGGGLYKSVDTGLNWTIINSSATNGYDIEFKPGDTNTIYASGNEFFISTDGGATFGAPETLTQWSQEYVLGSNNWSTTGANQDNSVTARTGVGMAICYVSNFTSPITNLVSPVLNLSGASNPELNFSYTNVNWEGDLDTLRVLYKTSATGNWVELANYTAESNAWTDIVLNLPNATADYYIAFEGTANYGRGLTLDDVSVKDPTIGTVFEDGFESLSNSFSNGPKMIGVSPQDPSVVYVLEASGGIFGGFHKSTDSGNTFTELDHAGKNYFGYSSFADDDSGQAPRDMDVVVHPQNAMDVHIAGVLSWRSTDGGVNFNITSQWVPGNAANQNIGYNHADIDIMEFVGNPTDGYKLYTGTDGGIYVADDPLNVTSSYYRDLTSGLSIRQFYRIGISQTDPVVVSGGSQDNGSSVLGADGVWRDWLGADGMEAFVDKNDADIIYGTSQSGTLYKSFNGGVNSSWIASPEGKTGNWITPFEQDPIQQNVIYVGYDEVYKSTNGGNDWISISQDFGGNLDHLKIAPSSSVYMYASRGSNLYKTESGGILGTWSQLSGFSGSINSIAIHPTDPDKIAIATTDASKVFVSSNGGTTWDALLLNLPGFSARALVWDHSANNGLYLGMNYGVFYINDTFTEWQPFSNNLPNVIISELEINTADNKLYAATYGRGLWSSDLFDDTLSVDDFELNSISMFPNPAKNQFSLSWNKGEKVAIKVYNSLGKLMFYTKEQSLIDPFKIDTSQFNSGVYFVAVNSLNGVVTKKLIIE